MTSPPCICFFNGYYDPHFGGVEKYTANLSKFLILNGYRVIVVTANTENVSEKETINEVEVIRLPVFSLFRARYPIPNFFSARYRALMKEIKNRSVDFFMINTRFYITSFIGLKLASRKNMRCLLIEHGTGHLITKNPVINFFAAQYEHFLTTRIKTYHPVFFGVSKACNTWLQHFKIEARGVIYNGIDTSVTHSSCSSFKHEYQIPHDHVVFSTASRLIPEKGVVELVNAFLKFSTAHQNAHLFLAGDGPLFEPLRMQYQHHRQIHILGKLPYEEVLSLFEESDVVIVPSWYPEGLPTVILEAGLANCALITTDVGGSSEVVVSKEFGLLIQKNDEGELLFAMEELYADEDLRKKMALYLHNKVLKEFDWALITKKLLSESFFTGK